MSDDSLEFLAEHAFSVDLLGSNHNIVLTVDEDNRTTNVHMIDRNIRFSVGKKLWPNEIASLLNPGFYVCHSPDTKNRLYIGKLKEMVINFKTDEYLYNDDELSIVYEDVEEFYCNCKEDYNKLKDEIYKLNKDLEEDCKQYMSKLSISPSEKKQEKSIQQSRTPFVDSSSRGISIQYETVQQTPIPVIGFPSLTPGTKN